MEITPSNMVERSVFIAAQPEKIFPYFTDPALMARWMGSTVRLDPRPGGIYQVIINQQDVAQGNFVEIDPPHRVVFTFGWQGAGSPLPPGSSTVEITLEASGGGTLVRLRHMDLPVNMRILQAQGWEHYLGRLGMAAVGEDPGPDPFAEPGGMNE